jgi:hypothetical protein
MPPCQALSSRQQVHLKTDVASLCRQKKFNPNVNSITSTGIGAAYTAKSDCLSVK